jgi:hypothetical protein
MRDIRTPPEREASWGWIAGYAAFAVFLRLVPYYRDFLPENDEVRWLWNFSAVGALGLFTGARLGSRAAYLVPLGTMLIADLLLIVPLESRGGAFNWMTPTLYASMTLNVAIGRLFRTTSSPAWAVPGGLLTGAQFFVASNLAEWAFSGQYERSLAGLTLCFEKALPFARGTFLGDLAYAVVFFGLFTVVQALAQREKASQPA